MNERRRRCLNYDEPIITILTKTKFTKEIQEFLLANMDGEPMSDALVEYWLQKENSDLAEEVDEMDAVPTLHNEYGFAYEEGKI